MSEKKNYKCPKCDKWHMAESDWIEDQGGTWECIDGCKGFFPISDWLEASKPQSSPVEFEAGEIETFTKVWYRAQHLHGWNDNSGEYLKKRNEVGNERPYLVLKRNGQTVWCEEVTTENPIQPAEVRPDYLKEFKDYEEVIVSNTAYSLGKLYQMIKAKLEDDAK